MRHGYNFSGGQGWYGIQDDIEQKLYGLRAFSKHGEPRTMAEASDR